MASRAPLKNGSPSAPAVPQPKSKSVTPLSWLVGLVGVEDVWNFDCTRRQLFPTGRNETRFFQGLHTGNDP